ncbi:MAG TPA: MerR family transcriptional regulator [Acidimicrobiia bacterium]|nr:MerR family transcriptional regulator [Acidimicrobiia bacterium]
MRRRAVFVISVAAELAGMHPQTLRIYERKGLIEPYRTPGGTRRYSQDDIERLKLISQLTGQGLNLEGVKQVLELQDEVKRLRGKVDQMEQRLDELAEEASRRMEEIHRSYRREIVVRSDLLPQRSRK